SGEFFCNHRRFSRRRNLPNRHPSWRKSILIVITLLIYMHESHKLPTTAEPENRLARATAPQATPEPRGASHDRWVSIGQVAGPGGPCCAPFGPGSTERHRAREARNEGDSAGPEAGRWQRKDGAEPAETAGSLPKEHPSPACRQSKNTEE